VCSTSRGCESCPSGHRVHDDRRGTGRREYPSGMPSTFHACCCGSLGPECFAIEEGKNSRVFLSFSSGLAFLSCMRGSLHVVSTRLLPWKLWGTREDLRLKSPFCETFPPPAYYLGMALWSGLGCREIFATPCSNGIRCLLSVPTPAAGSVEIDDCGEARIHTPL
jgi:hypothetical protein